MLDPPPARGCLSPAAPAPLPPHTIPVRRWRTGLRKGAFVAGALRGEATLTAQRRSRLGLQSPKRSPLCSGGGRSRAALPSGARCFHFGVTGRACARARPRQAKRCTPRAAALNDSRAVWPASWLSLTRRLVARAATREGPAFETRVAKLEGIILVAAGAPTRVEATAATPAKHAGPVATITRTTVARRQQRRSQRLRPRAH